VRTNKSIIEGKAETIIELRNKGYSYGKIKKETGFSKGSISYHIGPGQKEKSLERLRRQNGGFRRKVWGFIYGERGKKPKKPFVYKTTTLRKKGREFFYGDKRRKSGQNMKIKEPKIWLYWGKLFPGITSEEEKVQAVNQWTGEKDYYENGEPILYPYIRCKLTDEIVNIKGNDIHVDHADGDRTNNSIENFTIVKKWANQMKSDAPGYDIMEEKLEIMLNTRRKYK
jgi:hypothetical protein